MLPISLGFLPTKFKKVSSFLCSFSRSSSNLNHFVCNSAFLLKPVAKFAIAYVCDLGVWHFSCGLKIVFFFFAFSVRTFILIFLCLVLILSHEQEVKGFLLGIRFRLIHSPFLRLASFFSWEDSAEKFSSWKERSNVLEDRISMTVFVSVKTEFMIWNHFSSFFTSNPEPVLARSTFFQFFQFYYNLFLKISIVASTSVCVPSRISFRLSPKKSLSKSAVRNSFWRNSKTQKLLCLKGMA